MRRILERTLQHSVVAAPRTDVVETCRTAGSQRAFPARYQHGDGQMTKLDKNLTTELEAAAFRRLVEHFRKRTDVQNIDLMNLAGFCRNCLSKWYLAAAQERGVALTDPEARESVYGMPYEEWKKRHQTEASTEQKKAFAETHKH